MTRDGVRITSQDRSSLRRKRIAEAAIRTIAKYGLAGVTHRLVAKEAGVSLAATTYYYSTKADIIADAAEELLQFHTDSLGLMADEIEAHPKVGMRNYVIRMAQGAAGHSRPNTIAWFEIMFAAARESELRELAIHSFEGLTSAWNRICRAVGLDYSNAATRSALDTLIGLNLAAAALGINEEQVRLVLCGETDLDGAWRPRIDPDQDNIVELPIARTPRAQHTRDRIVAAAIELLITDGPSGVTLRSVAERAGMVAAAPSYHFPRLDVLLTAAHEQLFNLASERTQALSSWAGDQKLDVLRLTDFANTVLIREATEHKAGNIANYTLWMEASRRPELRPAIWGYLEDQYRGWVGLLEQVTGRHEPLAGLVFNAMFIGKVIRIAATGSSIGDLADARGELAQAFEALIAGKHWMLPG